MKRPVLWALAFLCAGIASGLTGADYGGWFPILMFSAAALSAAAICFAYRWPPAAVFFICFICGFLRVGQSLGSDPAVSQWVNDGETLRMTGYVLESKLTQTGRARAVFDVYLIESGKEFMGEYNGRWPELRRTGMLKFMTERYNYQMQTEAGNIDFNKFKLRPIPESAILLNDALTAKDQNPGY